MSRGPWRTSGPRGQELETALRGRRWPFAPASVGASNTEERPRRAPRGVGLLIALAFLFFYGLTSAGETTSLDGGVIMDTTRALVDGGTLALPLHHHGVPNNVAHPTAYYSKYGIALSLAEMPLYVAGERVAPHLSPALAHVTATAFASLTNVVVTALALWLFFLLAFEIGAGLRGAVVATIIVGVASPFWPYAKSDFTEPLAALGLLGAALFLVRARSRPAPLNFALSGLFFSLALLAKVTALLALPAFAAYALFVALDASPRGDPRRFTYAVVRLVQWAVGVGFGVVLTLDYNLVRFGSLTDTGYRNLDDKPFHAPLLDGLTGLLVSPGKGVLWYCPLLLLTIPLWRSFARRRPTETLLVVGITLPTLLVYATYPVWWGGYCWGPRYLVPVLPFVLLPLVSVGRLWLRRGWRRGLMVVLTTVAIVVQVLGVAVQPARYLVTGVSDAQYLRTASDSPLLAHAWFFFHDLVSAAPGSAVSALNEAYPWRTLVPAGTVSHDRLDGATYWWWAFLRQYGLTRSGQAAIILGLLGALAVVVVILRRRSRSWANDDVAAML